MICSICQNALSVDDFHAFFITDKGTKPHHLTYTSLKSSVDAGCYACNRLWACLGAEERQFVASSTGGELDGNDKLALGVNQGVEWVAMKKKPVTTIEANKGAGYGHAGSYLLCTLYAPIPLRPFLAQGAGRLGIAEVFDAEAEGVRRGLRAAWRVTPQGGTIHTRLDNASVVDALNGYGRMPTSSREALLEAREAARGRPMSFEWIPGHEG
ncbi:reverse transcriptase domain protein, partial [Colletotrichum sojae]